MVFSAGEGDANPRGMAFYNDDIYYCDWTAGTINKISKTGPNPSVAPNWLKNCVCKVIFLEAVYTLDDGGTLAGCGDIYFYIGIYQIIDIS